MFDLARTSATAPHGWRRSRSEIPLTGHRQRIESGLTSGLLVERRKPVNAEL
jgi:hypothetical protein